MPPKSKSGQAGSVTSSAVVDILSAEEMDKDQLEEHIIRLREELDREREEKSYFQLERDKIHSFWEISKRDVEEVKARLRNRQREREGAKERHRREITEYKQKLKHVLSEHHNINSGLKMDGVASTSLLQNRNVEAELRLRGERSGLQAELRGKKFHKQNCIKELKLKHQVELMELVNVYDRRIRDLEAKYHRKLRLMTEAEERRRKAEIGALEDRMHRRAVTLVEDQDRALRDAEEYYSGIQIRLAAEQRELKEDLSEATKLQTGAERELSAAQQENDLLTESLRETRQNLAELRQQREEQAEAKKAVRWLHKKTLHLLGHAVLLIKVLVLSLPFKSSGTVFRQLTKARVKVTEQERREVTVKLELLLQACEKVQQERDQLLRSQTDAILDVQQRSELKQMLLERQLAALREAVEKKEAHLCAALSASKVNQDASDHAENRLKEILQRKQDAVEALRRDLARNCQEYDQLLQSCQEKLKAQGVPLQDFPFKPSEQILGRL